jgi:hypothetical protein
VSVDWSKVDDAALALMYLTTLEHRGIARSWKGHDWDVLDRLYERGFISDPKTPAKSVVMTQEGLRQSRELFEQQFGKLDAAPNKRFQVDGSAAARGELSVRVRVWDVGAGPRFRAWSRSETSNPT